MSNNGFSENFDFTEMVNKHSAELKHQTVYEARERARSVSVGKSEIKYNQKKKKKQIKVNRAIAAVVIMTTLSVGAFLGSKVVDGTNVVIPITYELSHDIDSKIYDYFKKMNYTGNNGERIENAYGRNEAYNERYVDYSPGVLAEYIVNASLVSESEVRCVIYTAFGIINVPYRDYVITRAFEIINSDSNLKSKMSGDYDFLNVNDSTEFLQKLGYNDWKEYKKKEKRNIKSIAAVEKYMNDNKNRGAK